MYSIFKLTQKNEYTFKKLLLNVVVLIKKYRCREPHIAQSITSPVTFYRCVNTILYVYPCNPLLFSWSKLSTKVPQYRVEDLRNLDDRSSPIPSTHVTTREDHMRELTPLNFIDSFSP